MEAMNIDALNRGDCEGDKIRILDVIYTKGLGREREAGKEMANELPKRKRDKQENFFNGS
jgi:hypothetical protein